MEKKFVANKALLINPQGKILLIEYAPHADHKNSAGKLDVPGGRMDYNEHPSDALAREVLEETGIIIDGGKATPFFVDLWGVMGKVKDQPIVGIFYIVQVGDVEVLLSEEHQGIRWHDPRQPTPEHVTSGVRKAIEAFRKHEGIVTAGEGQAKGHEGFGLIQVITGNGKGKTTSALGTAIRAIGAGKKVGIIYFDKGGESHYSERKAMDNINRLTYVATGRDRIDPITNRFDFSITEIDKKEGSRGIEEVRKMFAGEYDLIILDEVNSSTDLGIISEQDVLRLIEGKPSKTELILTGRNAPESFIKKAHLVSEVKLLQHYFYSGVPAREGIDY